jgi:hypothetical protein
MASPKFGAFRPRLLRLAGIAIDLGLTCQTPFYSIRIEYHKEFIQPEYETALFLA